jgi:hypothetical protein
MGNKPSKDITKNEVENYIDNEIENNTKNITDILNKTVTDITTKIVLENASKIDVRNQAANTLTIGNIVGARNFRINQSVNTSAINKASVAIKTDINSIQDLANQVMNALKSTAENTSKLETAAKANADLKSTVTDNGGPEGIIKSIAAAAPWNNKSETETVDHIKNTVINKAVNNTLNQQTIQNIVETHITNNITQSNMQSCNMITTATNDLSIGNIINSSEFTIDQSATANSLNDCVLTAANATELADKLNNAGGITSTVDSTNKNVGGAALDATTVATKETTSNSSIMSTIQSVLTSPIAIAGIVLCCCVVIVVIFLMMMGGSNSGRDEGGDKGDNEG